jgi:drug/metabolite transporter (DMT)-like permease
VGWRRWLAILVGFAGVILIIRPGGQAFEAASLLAVLSVLGLAARDIFTRRIRAAVDTTQLTTWGFAAVALVGGGQLLVSGGARIPTSGEAALLAGSLVSAVAAYWWLTEATRVGELSAVMPFRYTRLLFALAIGLVVFGEVPDGWTFAGSALIVGSGIYAFLRERARARAAAVAEALPVAPPPR